MKTTTIVFLLVGNCLIAYAQNFSFSFGVDVAVPSRHLKAVAGNGIGASLRGEYFIKEHFGAIVTLGYTSFDKRTVFTGGSSTKISYQYSATPFQIGMKYYPMSHGLKPKGIYLSAETGMSSVSVKTTTSQKSDASSTVCFSYAPGIGYRVSKFDLSYRQQYIVSQGENQNYYGNFRLAYSF